MLLGGVCHGAGWTVIIWGALHGAYLCANNGWAWLRQTRTLPRFPRPVRIVLTLLAEMVVPPRPGFRPTAGHPALIPWRPTWPWAVFLLVLLFFAAYSFDKISEFIYFQF